MPQVASFPEKHASVPVDVQPLKWRGARARGLYRRAGPQTEHGVHYRRFFVPHLAGYRGWALFADDDFLFLGDVAECWRGDDLHAVMCGSTTTRPRAA